MSPPASPLRITIIGAGIAGLVCALALRRQGHHVTLLEKSLFKNETGSAIMVGPNVSGLLMRLGWDPESTEAVLLQGIMSVVGQTGDVKSNMHLGEMSKQWDDAWYLVHRVDFHKELMRLVMEPETKEPGKVELHLGVKIAEVDSSAALVTLSNGKVVEGDAVIGADGNKSITRKLVDPEAKLKPWGQRCYRFLVDREKLVKDPEVAELVAKEGFFSNVVANDRKFVTYPCRANRQINYACFLPEGDMETKMDDWEQKGNKTKLLEGFESFYPAAQKFLSYASDDDLKEWQLVDMDPLKCWNKERLALVGDAAHPFLPFMAQGGAQAIEDAIAIATLFQPGTKPADIPDLLQLYDSIRRGRAHQVQDITRNNGRDGDKGRPPPSALVGMMDFCHRHNEEVNTQQRLNDWRKARSEASQHSDNVR